MGTVATITAEKFPKQGPHIGRRTKVIFHWGDVVVWGTIVRDDCEYPWRIIIALDDGRYILSTECQYAPDNEPGNEPGNE